MHITMVLFKDQLIFNYNKIINAKISNITKSQNTGKIIFLEL